MFFYNCNNNKNLKISIELLSVEIEYKIWNDGKPTDCIAIAGPDPEEGKGAEKKKFNKFFLFSFSYEFLYGLYNLQ